LRLRPLLPLALVALPVAIAALLLANLQKMPFAQELITLLRGVGGEWWAIPLFLILYVLFALILMPVGILSAAAALAWGWEVGGLLDLIGCTIAALPPFVIGRRGLPRRVRDYLARHEIAFPAPEFFPLLILRTVPVFPYVALNYVAGVARYRLRPYVLATFLGSIPSVFLFAFFIDTLGDSATGAATQLRIAGACAAIAVLMIIGRWGVQYAARKARPQDGVDLRSGATEPPPERSSAPPRA
jgi:uncharacterized membrane protein YdjX (TVP38/TMEM64 family)